MKIYTVTEVHFLIDWHSDNTATTNKKKKNKITDSNNQPLPIVLGLLKF